MSKTASRIIKSLWACYLWLHCELTLFQLSPLTFFLLLPPWELHNSTSFGDMFFCKRNPLISLSVKLNSSQHKHSDLPEKNKNKKAQSEVASRRLCFESDTWLLFTWQHLGTRKKSSRWLMQWNTDVMHPNGCITKPPFHIQLKVWCG